MKSLYNRAYKEPSESFFDLDDYSRQSEDFWLPLHESQIPNQNDLIYQGRLFQKDQQLKQWVSYHYELYSDKIIRTLDEIYNQNNLQSPTKKTSLFKPDNQYQTQQLQQQQKNGAKKQLQYVRINSCYLKKVKYSESSCSNFKFGLRIQKGESKTELFTDNQDIFNKWYDEIKRFCILPKFAKKYKILTKIKNQYFVSTPQQYFYKCFRFSDQTQYQVRIIDKYTVSETMKLCIQKEIEILRKLDHYTILNVTEVYEDENNVFLIMEYCMGKDLGQKLNEIEILDEKIISDIMFKLLHGLAHMQSKKVFHRDIKLENIMIRNSNNLSDICITNFFFADSYEENKQQNCSNVDNCEEEEEQKEHSFNNNNKTHNQQENTVFRKCGTPGYIAPEMFSQNEYDSKVDVFSLGVVFYRMVYGKLPFVCEDYEELLRLNEQCNINFDSQQQKCKISQSGQDLLIKMLQKDPAKRQTASSLLKSAWFINIKNKNEKFFNINNQLPSLSTILENQSEFGANDLNNTTLNGTYIKQSPQLELDKRQLGQINLKNMGLKKQQIDLGDDDQDDVDEIQNLNLIESLNTSNYANGKEFEAHQETLFDKMKFINNQPTICGPGKLSKQIRENTNQSTSLKSLINQ